MDQVGVQLREARVARGMSLDDVAQVTKIPRPTLAALEAGDHTDLPAPIFIRGFVRAYAATVGLDATPLIWALDRSNSDGAPSATTSRPQQRPSRRERASDPSLLPLATSTRRGRGLGDSLQRGYVLLLVVAAGLMLAAWLMVGGQRPPASTRPSALR